MHILHNRRNSKNNSSPIFPFSSSSRPAVSRSLKQTGEYCHFLLLLQKKVTKEKESGKDNRFCFSPIAHYLFRSKKQETVRAFSGLPSHRYIIRILLLSFTPGKTGAIGWPALRAGPGVIVLYPGQNRGYWMASPPGWTWCYCLLPRAKPGLLDGQPSGLVVLIAIFVTLGGASATGNPRVISGFLTPEVSSSNSPGIAPGKWRPTTGTTPEGLTSS